MKCIASLSVPVSLLVAVVVAGGDSMDDMLRREIDMELFPRQQQAQVLVTNLQPFKGALGNAPAEPITSSGDSTRPFTVNGNTFTDFQSAASRTCDNQKNVCAQTANSQGDSGNLTVGDCDTQNTQCKAAASAATLTAFATLTTSNAEFDFFCEP